MIDEEKLQRGCVMDKIIHSWKGAYVGSIDMKDFCKYQSPIFVDTLLKDIVTNVEMQTDNMVYRAIEEIGVHVDKEELLKALKYDRGQYEKGFYDGFYHEKSQPKVGEWIPCSERLPKESKKVLACNITGFICIAQCYGEDRWYEDGGFGRIYIDAWMPLPEPYREE